MTVFLFVIGDSVDLSFEVTVSLSLCCKLLILFISPPPPPSLFKDLMITVNANGFLQMKQRSQTQQKTIKLALTNMQKKGREKETAEAKTQGQKTKVKRWRNRKQKFNKLPTCCHKRAMRRALLVTTEFS